MIEKIKVTSLEIIVTGTKDKPYFQIKYKEVGKEDYNIGYGSYDLNNVFNWKEECFEIVNQLAEEYNNKWITDRVPTKEECGVYGKAWFLVTIQQHKGDKTTPMQYEYTTIRGKEVSRWVWYGRIANVEVMAWQPLPEPYQSKEK